MKLKKFIVVVQWGSGPSYILHTTDDPKVAEGCRTSFRDPRPVTKNGKRIGANPTVTVFEAKV